MYEKQLTLKKKKKKKKTLTFNDMQNLVFGKSRFKKSKFTKTYMSQK